MEIDERPEIVGKKLWNIIRIVFMMAKTGISKSKLVMDLNLMIKRGNKLANKAITTLLLLHHHHHHHLSCHSAADAATFFSPKEYEFSCSNSPAFLPAVRRRYRHWSSKSSSSAALKYNDVTTVAAVQRVLEILNADDVQGAEPSTPLFLPGFGYSPAVKQLRVTDSPFPVKDDGDGQVDKAAEEFINKFYKNLWSQKRMAAAALDQSPYRGRAWVK